MKEKDFLDIIKEGLGGYPLSPVIAETLKFILSNRYESMAIVNTKNEVEFLDKLSEQTFKVRHGDARGKPVREIIPESGLPDVVLGGETHIGRLFRVQGRNRIVSRYPLIRNNVLVGAFGRVILHSLEELERVEKEAKNSRLRAIRAERIIQHENKSHYTFTDILGRSDAMKRVVSLAKKIAVTDSDVLVQGESGTGKELFAHAIHHESTNRSKPFVKVNCPAIPVEIAESELFGYEKGAFTGATDSGKIGKFETAQGGTIFLDEMGSLPLSIQAKLLRVIQEREIDRLGGRNVIRLKFRMIAATNINLKSLAEHGQFRADLYYRLSKVILSIPPLRERPEDVPIYLTHFLAVLEKRIGTHVKRVSDEVLNCLCQYPWPGNVRELFNVIEQSLFQVTSGEDFRIEHLPDHITKHGRSIITQSNTKRSLREIIDETERDAIKLALQSSKGNKREAAKSLGIQRSLLYLKMKKYKL